nr:ORF2 [Torque teno felis virus]QYD01829.1 ORF2 [Torque teno felis virus]QYD01838.1 ORF2 [Torque teno felis virus]QYD01862.1 ORF2 [Torque teno felis virus]
MGLTEEEKSKIHCALWLQSCSRTHKLWCDCPVWTSHIKGWRPTEGDPVGHTVGDVGNGGTVIIDQNGTIVDDAGHAVQEG